MRTRTTLAVATLLAMSFGIAGHSVTPVSAQEKPPGPVAGTRITEAYVRQVAQSSYLWAWPMVNVHNRHAAYEKLPGPGLAGGVLPIAPPNHLCMLRDYIEPSERAVACPNQDVVYGQCVADFSKEPVVVQVPDFGERFWVYQVVDQRTDSFASLGKMHGTKPGFYLLAATDWKGKVPDGIAATFRCSTKTDAKLREVFAKAAVDAEKEIVTPLFQFHNYGLPLSGNWTTQTNGARFGTDYFTRLAVAKSNIFVNQATETRYFYQDLDASGERLDGSKKYTVTFPKGQLPPVKGFWSLTLYNEHHFFHPNDLKRYSLGTKNKSLKPKEDGSLTLYVQADPPEDSKRANWLPAPKGEFSLYIRCYWPDAAITDGKWTPPAVQPAK